MKTGAIREKDSKGRHTTTSRELILLESGVTLIDTPGMREMGMCDVEDGIEDTFSDIKELECKCKFSDCSHQKEPGCAVRAALDNGTLDLNRWELYNNLLGESKWSAGMKAVPRRVQKLNKYKK